MRTCGEHSSCQSRFLPTKGPVPSRRHHPQQEVLGSANLRMKRRYRGELISTSLLTLLKLTGTIPKCVEKPIVMARRVNTT